MRRVLVLHPQVPAMKPCTIIRMLAAARNHRDGILVSAEALARRRPSRLPPQPRIHPRLPKINPPALFIGKNNVIKAVVVEVDEADAVVLEIFVEQSDTLWQVMRQPLP